MCPPVTFAAGGKEVYSYNIMCVRVHPGHVRTLAVQKHGFLCTLVTFAVPGLVSEYAESYPFLEGRP